jgi:hypothetical protein
MGGACSTEGVQERCTQSFGGGPEGRRRLGRPGRRIDDNIKMNLLEVGWRGHGLDCSDSGQGELAGACKCCNEPSGSIKRG